VYLALQAGSGSTPIEVRGHEGVALSAGGRTSLIWPETPTRTIILDGTYTVDEIVAIANGLEFGS
jgi:hypothetical protein